MERPPQTFGELFEFYYTYVKLLYSQVQTTNQLPSEVLFEINAAFDHLSRHWRYGQDEGETVIKAYSHLKRSCLDIFKLKVKEVRDQYDELRKIDTSVLDNGKFDGEMRQLFAVIKKGATDARCFEGVTKGENDADVQAFDRWAPVYAQCQEFEERFYKHTGLDWAKKKGFHLTFKKGLLSIVSAVIVGVCIKEPIIDGIKGLWAKIEPTAHTYIHWL